MAKNIRTTKTEPTPRVWITNKDAQEYLGVSADFMKTLREGGHLTYSKIGKTIFYPIADLNLLIQKNIVVTSRPARIKK